MSHQLSQNAWGLSEVLGICGVAVAAIAVLWTIYRDRGDKAKLQVTASIGFLTAPADMPECMSLNVTNVGKRPVTINSWGGQLTPDHKERNFFVIHDPSLGGSELPKKLDSGEAATLITTGFRDITVPTLDNMYVADSSGKKWYISKANRNELRQFHT